MNSKPQLTWLFWWPQPSIESVKKRWSLAITMENEFNNQIVRCLWRESARQMEFDFTMKQSFCSTLHCFWDLEKREGPGFFAMQYWFDQVFFLKPFNSFHIQREHSNISQLTIFKDLHFSNMIWMCFFSIASNYDEPIVNADFNNIFMYIYIHIWVHIRLSQKMTPLKFLKSKPMWYLRASWTTNLKISRRVFFLGHREEKDVLIQM